MKNKTTTCFKIAVSVGILLFLCWKASGNNEFANVYHSEKNWDHLAAAQVLVTLGIGVSFWRWYGLVRALQLPITLFSALRIGYIGHAFGLVSIGTFGSDAVRVFYVAKENPDQKTLAFISVFVDRLCGLLGLFILTSAAILSFQYLGGSEVVNSQTQLLQTVTKTVTVMTVVGLFGFASLFLLPLFEKQKWVRRLGDLRWAGPIIDKVLAAGIAYQRRPLVLLLALLQSVLVHTLLTLSVFCVAVGLSGQHPSLGDHFILSPVAHLPNVLPLPGGIGGLEVALDYFYRAAMDQVQTSYGLIVALGYRMETFVVAIIGIVFYLRGRGEINKIMQSQVSSVTSHD